MLFTLFHLTWQGWDTYRLKTVEIELIYIRDVGLAILLSDAISIENFLSFQIAIATASNKYLLLSRLCKYHLLMYLTIKTSWDLNPRPTLGLLI